MLRLFSTIAVLLVVGNLYAVEVDDLYLVKLPIAQQSKTARWNASLQGFKEVLVRKSGSSNILKSYEVQQAYQKVTSYLQKFKYDRLAEKNVAYPYLISLYFEPRLIDSLIQDTKMPLWGANRPVTMLWIVVEENFNRRILIDATQSEISVTNSLDGDNQQEVSLTQSINENAIRRGLPVISPLMDLEDELVVSISDIWGRFPSTVVSASQRYLADSVVLGRIKKQGEQWLGEFTYVNQAQQSSFEVFGEHPQQVISQLIDQLADLLCSKYCVFESAGEKNQVILNLSSVSSFANYKAAEAYLNNLSTIKQVEIIKIEQQAVYFKLTLFGEIESLVEGIALSQRMQIDESAAELAFEKNSDQLIIENPIRLDEQRLKIENNTSGKIISPLLDRAIGIENDKIRTLFYRWFG